MASIPVFLLGVLDTLAALSLLLDKPILGIATKYLALALLLKGVWTCIVSLS